MAVFLLVIAVLFDAYLHLSRTYQENSDEANILLMADDMLHGNLILHGWSVSDVPFITTELPQIALLVGIFGLRLGTAHVAAALTYTLVVAVGMLLARGRARGWKAVARMGLALGIMLAPQPGVGVFAVVFSVGHIGTALPVLLTWLVLDRFGRKWYVAAAVALLLGWALTADPLVLVIAVYPLLAVCLARIASALAAGARRGGAAGLRAAAPDRRFEVWLAAAAGAGYLIAWTAGQFIRHSGGFVQQPVPYKLDATRTWFWHAQVVVHGLLEMFGAYFVPGQAINYLKPGVLLNPSGLPAPPAPLSGLDQAIALTHLAGVVLAVWGACAIARRFFLRDADIVSQLLLAGIVANLAAYIPSTLANATALNVREIAPVLPFAAVLAARMLGDRLVTGPLATIRLPARLSGIRPPARAQALAGGAAGRHGLRVRLVAAPLAVLLGWYGYGLFRQAGAPPAPAPLANVAALLERYHLRYGLGGYWEASVLTVETGGKVTVRAVTPACLQPYTWESKADWYNPEAHNANFVLLSNLPGYFTQFNPSGAALTLLNTWSQPPYVRSRPSAFYRQPHVPRSTLWPAHLVTGGYYLLYEQNGRKLSPPVQIWYYQARVYPMNLLRQFKRLAADINSPPRWLVQKLGAAPLPCQ